MCQFDKAIEAMGKSVFLKDVLVIEKSPGVSMILYRVAWTKAAVCDLINWTNKFNLSFCVISEFQILVIVI
jgi:hypothetical protein